MPLLVAGNCGETPHPRQSKPLGFLPALNYTTMYIQRRFCLRNTIIIIIIVSTLRCAFCIDSKSIHCFVCMRAGACVVGSPCGGRWNVVAALRLSSAPVCSTSTDRSVHRRRESCRIICEFTRRWTIAYVVEAAQQQWGSYVLLGARYVRSVLALANKATD